MSLVRHWETSGPYDVTHVLGPILRRLGLITSTAFRARSALPSSFSAAARIAAIHRGNHFKTRKTAIKITMKRLWRARTRST
jgi:hypothetical protein